MVRWDTVNLILLLQLGINTHSKLVHQFANINRQHYKHGTLNIKRQVWNPLKKFLPLEVFGKDAKHIC
jgi:hypothetical protein